MQHSKLRYAKLVIVSIAMLTVAGFALSGRFSSDKIDSTYVGSLGGSEPERSAAAFGDAAKVFFSARCANCHPAGDAPTQGDTMTPHAQGVTRGKDGKGVYGMKCNTCHQNENLEGPHLPPGTSTDWHMPPADQKMVFQGLTAGQLCRQLKDPTKNGGHKTVEAAMDHILKKDPLVMWAWEPGNGRMTPPMSYDEFTAKIKEWMAAGAVCPA